VTWKTKIAANAATQPALKLTKVSAGWKTPEFSLNNTPTMLLVRGVGFEPTYLRRHHQSVVSSQLLSLFSFSGSTESQVKKRLAGDESDESGKSQMSSMRLRACVERRDAIHASRRVATLRLPKLCTSIFKVVNNRFPFFSSF